MTRAMVAALIAGQLALVIVVAVGVTSPAWMVTIPSAVAGLVLKIARR